jgi:hypothetical protein
MQNVELERRSNQSPSEEPSSSQCRSCGQVGLTPILSLGKTPLANRLLTDDQLGQEEPRFPLDLVLCTGCALVQITETVAPEVLFSDYAYFSSFSDGMLRSAEELTHNLVSSRKLGPGSLAMEIASNDGYLLQFYKQQGVPVLGIEPAANIAQAAEEQRGIPTICQFFGRSIAERLSRRGQLADVVHANNVLAHVADLNGFVAGLQLIVRDDGIAVIEAPYVKDLVDHSEFDTIYHEHLCYFSLTALDGLFRRHGLRVVDVERIAIHGGSLRVFVGRTGNASARVTKLLGEEQEWGVSRPQYYEGFGRRVERLREELLTLLKQLKCQGRRIAVYGVYGASAKGSTLLNYFGLGRETLDFVVDRSTVKQGRYTPGTHLKIYSPEKLAQERPDYVLLLSWNFADEILAQQEAYRRTGGKFIIPIPQLKVA